MMTTMANTTLHVHRRSHCMLCGARAWTRSIRDRVAFIDAHRHATSPWRPAPKRTALPLPYRWPAPMIGACVGIVAALIVVLP